MTINIINKLLPSRNKIQAAETRMPLYSSARNCATLHIYVPITSLLPSSQPCDEDDMVESETTPLIVIVIRGSFAA